MKFNLIKSILLCFAAFIFQFQSTFAQQDFQGKAYYSSKTSVDISRLNNNRNLSEDMKKRIAERLKKQNQKNYTLTFNKVESIFKVAESLESPNQGQGDWARFGSMMSGATDGEKYKNIETKQSLTTAELIGKQFLITEELPKLEWKMTGETKQVGQYTCMKATAVQTWTELNSNALRPKRRQQQEETDDILDNLVEIPVTAWFTLQIPVSHGPSDYWGLPGLILEINTPDTTILCSKIVLNPGEKTKLKEPTKGKEISREDYIDLAKKKFAEMRENFRRGGGRSGFGRN